MRRLAAFPSGLPAPGQHPQSPPPSCQLPAVAMSSLCCLHLVCAARPTTSSLPKPPQAPLSLPHPLKLLSSPSLGPANPSKAARRHGSQASHPAGWLHRAPPLPQAGGAAQSGRHQQRKRALPRRGTAGGGGPTALPDFRCTNLGNHALPCPAGGRAWMWWGLCRSGSGRCTQMRTWPRCTRRRGSGLSAWPGGGCWQVWGAGWAVRQMHHCEAAGLLPAEPESSQRPPRSEMPVHAWPACPLPAAAVTPLLLLTGTCRSAGPGAAQRAPAGAACPGAQCRRPGHRNGR